MSDNKTASRKELAGRYKVSLYLLDKILNERAPEVVEALKVERRRLLLPNEVAKIEAFFL